MLLSNLIYKYFLVCPSSFISFFIEYEIASIAYIHPVYGRIQTDKSCSQTISPSSPLHPYPQKSANGVLAHRYTQLMVENEECAGGLRFSPIP